MASRRPLAPATDNALEAPTVTLVYIVRLDIEGDPILVWTGYGDQLIDGTGDDALDGLTFSGITHLVGEVGAAADGQGGSAALELALPGVDLQDEAMRQVVYDRRRWQYRRAWVWMAFLDEEENIIGRPFRLKTGRIDKMPVEEDDDGTGTVKCRIESQQAYAGEALASRYSETKELDPTDTSQDYVWSLANMEPNIGTKTTLQGGAGSALSGGNPIGVLAYAIASKGK